MKTIIAGLLAVFIALPASAAVQMKEVTYQDGDQELKGYIAWDDSIKGKRPGIMVIHEWWGLNDYVKDRARMLAEMGYVAFAADMYGTGKVTTHAPDAKGWMQQITKNKDAWQQRAMTGLEQLQANELVDAGNVASIGYCFGGATVMQMAYAGADVKGVVSFHGALPPASPDQAKAVKTKVLVEHGEADGFIPAERITKFKGALDGANVDYTFNVHPGAKHGFTNPGAGEFGLGGLAYDKTADEKSWASMQAFLKEVLGQ